MFKIQKTASFEACHFIEGHKGKCASTHGHSYLVEVVVKGKELDKLGMLMDFSDLNALLKDLVEPFDHAFVYNSYSTTESTNLKVRLLEELNEKLCPFPANTTAENMAEYFFHSLSHELGETYPNVVVDSVTVHEKQGNPATYTEE